MRKGKSEIIEHFGQCEGGLSKRGKKGNKERRRRRKNQKRKKKKERKKEKKRKRKIWGTKDHYVFVSSRRLKPISRHLKSAIMICRSK
jgi:hypothetical protein